MRDRSDSRTIAVGQLVLAPLESRRGGVRHSAGHGDGDPDNHGDARGILEEA
jgi:hypothetical protein